VYVIDVHSPSLVIELPVSVALREYVHIPYKADNRVTRDRVLHRDRHICAYFGGRADTVDHVLPRCRRGGDTWFSWR
jgi:5-methylcytosine-specific restriction endonuclease McrA